MEVIQVSNPNQLTKVTTGQCRLSYLKVAKAEGSKQFPKQAPRFSVCVLIDKSDEKTLAKVRAAIAAAVEDFFGAKAPKLKAPLRDGDVENPTDAAYKGMMYINAWTGEDSPPMLKQGDSRDEVLNPREWNSGDYGNVILNFKAYDQEGGKGVGAYLGGIWFRKKGSPLIGTISDTDFDDVEDDDLLG